MTNRIDSIDSHHHYSVIGPLLLKVGKVGPIFGQEVCSTFGTDDDPGYVFSQTAINHVFCDFTDLTVSIMFAVYCSILIHGPLLYDDIAMFRFDNADTMFSE
jgi:hypothetical protein